MLKCILMGVSGCGKTSIGKALASKFAITFLDGDLLHLKHNIDKMAQGLPLNDNDRAPWLERVGDVFYAAEHLHTSVLIASSCLKKAYRDYLVSYHPGLIFIYLKGDKKTILSHMQERRGHFMKSDLLDSQFLTLEEPCKDEPYIHSVSIAADFNTTLNSCIRILDNIKHTLEK